MASSTRHRETVRRFDSPEQEAYLALWRTYDRLREIEAHFFERWDLTAQQYNVLRLLRAAHPEPVPTLGLVAKLVSRAPDITRLLDKLEARGLITRTRGTADRRAVLISITDGGLTLLDEIAEPLQECHETQLGHLSGPELDTLITLLNRAREPHEDAGSEWK
jgi:DNA-binding MarR family transcriptional regulator|nr:MarR family transcriptional regulator [Fimbriiglobus sp.]